MKDRTKRQSPTDIVHRLSREDLESIVLAQLDSENSALENSGDSKRLQAFIDSHLDLAPVRDIAIRKARDSHDLAKAEMLARDGICLSSKQGYTGIVDHYAMELVSILDERGQPDAAIEFAVARTISSCSMNWYKEVMKRIGNAEGKETVQASHD